MDEEQPSREEILLMAKYAGLHLLPPYQDELVEAYGHVRRLVASMPKCRSRDAEPAHTFAPARYLPNAS